MTADYELIEVSQLMGSEAVKDQVIQDEQVWGEEGATH